MLHFFRLLLLLINLDENTILTWFGVEKSNGFSQSWQNQSINMVDLESSSELSWGTIKLIMDGLLVKFQDGLTLADIENILFFILFIRFIVLVIRYNLSTSFCITAIGLFAGYLWYRHLIDLISMYRSILIKLPYLHNLGIDAVQLRAITQQTVLTDFKLSDSIPWYNPGQVIYYAFTNGMVHVNQETGLKYYIDPISMLIANLEESTKETITPIYYRLYSKIIPQLFQACSKFWSQLSGIAAYAVITRIGKRYCPYLVRWHWTFLLIIGFIEQIIVYFVYRMSYFQEAILIPQSQVSNNLVDQSIISQVNSLNLLITLVISLHLGLIFVGLFHAIWGQYFYFPFLVENTELHIGPRPKNSIYSGGQTAWQDPKEKEKSLNRLLPKLWYGWFGRGTGNGFKLNLDLRKLLKRIFKE